MKAHAQTFVQRLAIAEEAVGMQQAMMQLETSGMEEAQADLTELTAAQDESEMLLGELAQMKHQLNDTLEAADELSLVCMCASLHLSLHVCTRT